MIVGGVKFATAFVFIVATTTMFGVCVVRGTPYPIDVMRLQAEVCIALMGTNAVVSWAFSRQPPPTPPESPRAATE